MHDAGWILKLDTIRLLVGQLCREADALGPALDVSGLGHRTHTMSRSDLLGTSSALRNCESLLLELDEFLSDCGSSHPSHSPVRPEAKPSDESEAAAKPTCESEAAAIPGGEHCIGDQTPPHRSSSPLPHRPATKQRFACTARTLRYHSVEPDRDGPRERLQPAALEPPRLRLQMLFESR